MQPVQFTDRLTLRPFDLYVADIRASILGREKLLEKRICNGGGFTCNEVRL